MIMIMHTPSLKELTEEHLLPIGLPISIQLVRKISKQMEIEAKRSTFDTVFLA